MRASSSKHPNMPLILKILRERPETQVAYLARTYGVPDATIRHARETDIRRAAMEAEIAKVVGVQNPQTPPTPLRATPPTPASLRIAVIGDMQVKPDIDLGYCSRIGKYMAHKKPDVIVCIGDFADMPSLSFWEEPGSKAYNLQNYKADLVATHQGMRLMMEPILAEIKNGWNPRLVMTLGNHEDRITRTLEKIPKLDGTIGLPDLEYERWGWEVIPFLKPIIIQGIAFCHYFCTGAMGRPASSARAILNKMHMSAVAGHQQGRDMAMGKRGDGSPITAIICGSTYEHDENYLNHQTNNHWRGLYILNNCVDGAFDENAVPLSYLREKYGE